MRNSDPLYIGKKGERPPKTTVACAAVTNLKDSRHAEETANKAVQKCNLPFSHEPLKTTKFLPSGGFGSIVAKVNKQKPREAVLIDPCGQYTGTGGNSRALRLQTVSDKPVKGNITMVALKQPKEQNFSPQKIPATCEPHKLLKEKLYKKYKNLTTTWPNNMPLEDMEQMIKFRCFSSRPEDAVAMKVMERLMAENSAHKQVCTLQFTLFPSKDYLLTFL